MAEYIDKDALVAKIKNLENTYKEYSTRNSYEKGLKNGRLIGYRDALHKINILEVRDMNFEDTKSVFEGQYLSKDRVVTTIERLQNECEEQGDNNGVELLEKLFTKLDTLEVKKVDSIIHTIIAECCDWLSMSTNLSHDEIEGCRNLMLTVKEEQFKNKKEKKYVG